MRTLLFHSRPLSTLLVLFFLLSVEVVAQEDPFGGSSANPFGGRPVNPGAKEVPRRDDQQEILRLQSRLKATQNRLREMEQNNKILKSALTESRDNITRLESRVAGKLTMHQRIFEQLLNSDDQKNQERALDHLIVCLDNEGTGPDKLSLDPYKPEVIRRLSRMVDSDQESIQHLAVRALSTIAPGTAIDMGFQYAPIWQPTTRRDTEMESRIYRAFEEPADFHFEQIPIFEILEEVQQNYQIHVVLAKDLDKDLLITFRSQGLELADTLAHILDNFDLTFRVIDNRILVVKKTDGRVKKAETYNVRGLLSEKLDVAGIVKLVMEGFEESAVSIQAIDGNRIVVHGSEIDQRGVGKALASLAKKDKW